MCRWIPTPSEARLGHGIGLRLGLGEGALRG